MIEAEIIERYKQQAAERAAQLVTSGMIVGLGTGSTAIYATRRIGRMLQEGRLRDIWAVATSTATAAAAEQLGIPLLADDDTRDIDLTIDGADEVSPELDLIKGGGGALLREKIVAEASLRRVIVVDDSKLSARLGTRRAVPVEVVPFGWRRLLDYLRDLGGSPNLRMQPDGRPFVTDQGNLVLDCSFGPVSAPGTLAMAIRRRAGIVEHGLFIGLTTDLIVAGSDGTRHLTASAVRDELS
jgi:ribose 5-phosphate isomerase A